MRNERLRESVPAANKVNGVRIDLALARMTSILPRLDPVLSSSILASGP